MDDFNLLDRPWIPVRLTSGKTVLVSLQDLFRRQSEIVSLANPRPPGLVSTTRLLLAITHRALTCHFTHWTDRDRFSWYQEGLPSDVIVEYLERWRSRFNAFDRDFPFMQAAVLSVADETRDKTKPWTQIDLASASGNMPMVFDHACDLTPTKITPTEAVGLLLEYQAFVPGGLVKVFRSADKAGPLANTAAVIPVGSMLWQTLCLNLHPAPVRSEIEDLPCWERPVLTVKDLSGPPTLATGPNDRYTRLSRSVLLLPETDGSIRWLRFGAGLALDEDPQAPDPMAAYRPGSQSLVRLTFTEGRALWRDLPALLPAAGAEGGKAPTVLEFAAQLRKKGRIRTPYQQVWVAGLASDQAKLLRWRLEQIVLPEKLLLNESDVRIFLDFVRTADALYGSLRSVAVRLIQNVLPKYDPRDRQAQARRRFDAQQYAAGFFSAAEQALPVVLQRLQDGELDQARESWGLALQAASRQMWDTLQKNQGFAPEALSEQAQQAPYFFGAIRAQLKDFMPVKHEGDDLEVMR